MSSRVNYQDNVYTHYFQVAPGVWGMKDVFVNMYMILNPFDGNWVLVDAGLKWSARKIKSMARQLFGAGSVPSSIILTHGHFDHVGSLRQLVKEWESPVFAHYLEIPYLTGKSPYPPADPTVGGGLVTLLSWSYPTSPINIQKIHILPENGRVPGLPEWKYIHTPGHAPGHVSLYRESDNVLIAGDALVTTTPESLFSVLLQTKKISGPPKYLTYDWIRARESVKTLAALQPEVIAAGHGTPMNGSEVHESLEYLSDHFYKVAVPHKGRYLNEPAITNAMGLIYVPPSNIKPRTRALTVLGIVAVAAFAGIFLMKKKKEKARVKEALAYDVW